MLPFSLRLSNFHPFICHTALHTAISLFLSIPLSLTIHSSVTFHNQLIWFQSYALNFTLHLFKCGLCIIFLSPLSWTRVQMHLCIYACLSHLCVSFYCIYEHLLSINAQSPSLTHSIHLYFKTFPHLPPPIWLSITLPICPSHPLILQHDGWFLLRISLITWPLSFLTENTFQNITCESHSHPALLSDHIKGEFLSNTKHFKLY